MDVFVIDAFIRALLPRITAQTTRCIAQGLTQYQRATVDLEAFLCQRFPVSGSIHHAPTRDTLR